MRTELLDYDLPADLIAQHPLAERDASRLLSVQRQGVSHRQMAQWPDLVPEGALVVVNDTRVMRARLIGTRPTGGSIELLLLRRLSVPGEEETWESLARPLRRLREGMTLDFGELSAEVRGRVSERSLEVRLRAKTGSVQDAMQRVGHVPLPPYVQREDTSLDQDRYQTVFARDFGSVAAPTAGLHFTQGTLARLEARSIEVASLTLHVGPGTFRPVSTDDLDQHDMHVESYVVSTRVADAITAARMRGNPVVAIGTTVVRALESAKDPTRPGYVRPEQGETKLLIQPGYRFEVVDSLLTNFHMPKSTLLSLVGAFAGLERTLDAYRSAVQERYRFLSYGDAMWIAERLT